MSSHPAIQSLQKLRMGHIEYICTKAHEKHLGDGTAQPDKPKAAILSCGDSRVPVELIFDTAVDQLFVVRAAGAVLGPDQIGSLEYACQELGVQLVVVLGHTKCGAIASAMEGGEAEGGLGILLRHLRNAVHFAQEAAQHHTISESEGPQVALVHYVDHARKSILKRSTVLSDFVKSGKIKIVGAVYNISTGQVEFREHYTIGLSEQTAPTPNPEIDDVVNFLIAGNSRFLAEKCPKERLEELAAKGQHPWACVLACSDSRVPVENIFNVGFGELFVNRTLNFTNQMEVIGSIEYACGHLKCPLIFILGHIHCPKIFAPVAHKEHHQDLETAFQAVDNVKNSILKNSAHLRELTEQDQVRIAGAIYVMHTGEIYFKLLTTSSLELNPSSFPLTSSKALEIIQEGNQRYVSNFPTYYPKPEPDSPQVARRPVAVFVVCTTFPRDVAEIFDMEPSNIVVVKTYHLEINQNEISSLENYTEKKDCPLVVILGHADPLAASEQKDDGLGPLSPLKQHIEHEIERTVKHSTTLKNLIHNGKLKIIGSVYNSKTKLIHYYC